ncbi:MAG: hypothetical protein GXO62_05235 [Epsilonproteobacteria bacterium]|nr:hypothetical protein [Campylobacterota bacterium]
MFKSFSEEKVLRFREFDDARGDIEHFNENSLDAIDYMISHKEYYFLLKNLLNQLPDEKIADYIFLNLPCLKREEDLEIIEKLMDKYPVVKDYLKSCKNEEFIKKLYQRGKKKEAIGLMMSLPQIKEWLKNALKNEDNEIKKEALSYFEIYEPEYAKELKEQIGNR